MRHEGRRQLEPQRTADEYIDDLPLRDGSAPDRTTHPTKRASIRPATVVGLLCAVALFVCGWSVAALQYVMGDRSDMVPGEPQPTVTVTVIETEVSLPPACQQALKDFDRYLDAAATISKSGTPQLDIMGEAHRAIILKDWKALNEVVTKQRDLQRQMGPASSKVLPVLIEVKEGMERCQSQLD